MVLGRREPPPCVCVCVCVLGLGSGAWCILRVSAYCLSCRHGDDIMAHDRRTTERMPPVFFVDEERGTRWRDRTSDEGMEEMRNAGWARDTDRE